MVCDNRKSRFIKEQEVMPGMHLRQLGFALKTIH